MQTDAQREDAIREADRLDPSVDHTDADYEPGDVSPRAPRGQRP